MGEPTVMQESLFYGFSLGDHAPTDHGRGKNLQVFAIRTSPKAGHKQAWAF